MAPSIGIAAGEHLAREFRRHTTPLPGTAEEYARRVGSRLTPSGTHWQFEVVKDDIGGVTRAPVYFPGYIFVPARLLLMTGSEAELAGMLAHAVARLEEAPEPAAYGVATDFMRAGVVERERAKELAADRRASEIVAAAGYNPRALADYLRRVQPASSPKGSRLPELEERVSAIEQAASAGREWKETTAAFSDAQEFVRKYGTRGKGSSPR
jgi:predicted Zn-dependent protease